MRDNGGKHLRLTYLIYLDGRSMVSISLRRQLVDSNRARLLAEPILWNRAQAEAFWAKVKACPPFCYSYTRMWKWNRLCSLRRARDHACPPTLYPVILLASAPSTSILSSPLHRLAYSTCRNRPPPTGPPAENRAPGRLRLYMFSLPEDQECRPCPRTTCAANAPQWRIRS